MIQHQTLEDARNCGTARRDVRKPQFVGSVTDLILPTEATPAPRPQAFLVEQSAHWTLPTHFHLEHQFQVFVDGGGLLGKRPIQHLEVHYASPHSGYGPLISGDSGVSYLTLRAVGDTGAWYLPEQRENCLRIPKVQAHGAPAQSISADALRALAAPLNETLIEPRVGGLAAWLMRLGAGQRCGQPPGAGESGGRFVVVTQGCLTLDTARLEGLAVAWVSPDDTLELVAGDTGLEAVILQFPAAAAQSFVETSSASAEPGTLQFPA